MSKKPHYVEPYLVSVTKKGSPDERLPLGVGKGLFNLSHFLKSAFENWPEDEVEELKSKTGSKSIGVALHIKSENFKFEPNAVYGKFGKGRHGSEYSIRNIFSKEEAGKLEREQFLDIPFMFYIHITPGENEALLLLQYFQGDGIKSEISHRLNRYSNTISDPVSISINPAYSPQQAKRIIDQGALKGITVKRYFKEPLEVDQLNKGKSLSNEKLTLTQHITAGRKTNVWGHTLLKNFVIGGDSKLFEIIDVSEPEEADIVTAKIEYAGRTRHIDHMTLEKFKPYFDLDDTVKFDSQNNIEMESFVTYAKGLANQILSEIHE